jgi:capsule assembly protein Wzi
VPAGHWSYQVFDRLASLGLIPLDAVTARPITLREARRLVGEALSHSWIADSETIRLVASDLQRLRQAFSVDPVLEIQGRGLAGNRAIEFTPDLTAAVSSAAAGLALSDNWFLFGRVAGGDSPGDPPAGEFYTSFQLGSSSFQLGRTSSSWGPSLRTSLFLSDNAGTLPLFRLTAELPQARLTKVIASLERSGGSPPGPIVLFATRFDWMVTPQFRVGLNEALVTAWGGQLTWYDLLEPIPVLSQIIAGYELHDRLGQARNSAVAVDFDWLLKPGTKLYGVGFINDMPERIAERLARIGVLAGMFLADPFKDGDTSLRFEYSAITNGTYSYPNAPELAYAYRGRSLGYWLGPDGEDLYIEMSRHLNTSTDLQFSYAHTRHGQGRIGQPAPPPSDWFLSGIVEERNTFGLQLQTIHSPSFETRYRAEMASVINQGNVAGAKGWEWLLGLDFTYRWSSPQAEGVGSAEFGPAQESVPIRRYSPGSLEIRYWTPSMSSSGPLAGPVENAALAGIKYWASAGDFALSLAFEAGSAQSFWSADLHYPIARFQHGAVSVFTGWGGLTRHGTLGGAIRDLAVDVPRLGADFFYQFAPGGVGTPLYVAGELASPLRRGPPGQAPLISGPDAPFYYWTYNVGAGWQFPGGWQLEGGYRGAVAVWQAHTLNETKLYWDGFYASLILR